MGEKVHASVRLHRIGAVFLSLSDSVERRHSEGHQSLPGRLSKVKA